MPSRNVVDRYSLSTCAVFLTLKLGQEGLGTRDWKIRNLFSWKSESFIWRYGKDLRHTNQTSYPRFSQVFYKKLVNFSDIIIFLLIFTRDCIFKEKMRREGISIVQSLGLHRPLLNLTVLKGTLLSKMSDNM